MTLGEKEAGHLAESSTSSEKPTSHRDQYSLTNAHYGMPLANITTLNMVTTIE